MYSYTVENIIVSYLIYLSKVFKQTMPKVTIGVINPENLASH